MINNSRWSVRALPLAALCWTLLGAAGCDAHADAPRDLQGVVEFDERTLAFDVGGRLATVDLRRGQSVAADALVARIDDSLEIPQRAARNADVDAARAQLALLRAGVRREDVRATAAQLSAARQSERILVGSLARQQRLAATGAIPTAPLDELQNQLVQLRGQRDTLSQRLSQMHHGARPEEIATAEARLSGALAARDLVEARWRHYTLRSPSAGVVLELHADPGEVVSPGAPIATLGDLDHPFVDVFVPQGRMAEVRRGGAAHLRTDSHSRRFHGVVEYVGSQTEFTPRFLFSDRERPNLVVRVRVRVEDPEHRLHAGVPAFVTLDPVPR